MVWIFASVVLVLLVFVKRFRWFVIISCASITVAGAIWGAGYWAYDAYTEAHRPIVVIDGVEYKENSWQAIDADKVFKAKVERETEARLALARQRLAEDAEKAKWAAWGNTAEGRLSAYLAKYPVSLAEQSKFDLALKSVYEAYPFLESGKSTSNIEAIQATIDETNRLIAAGKDRSYAVIHAADSIGLKFQQ